MRIVMAQLHVTPRLPENLERILAVIGDAGADEWVVFPECALTGYFPDDEAFLHQVEPAWVEESLAEVTRAVQARRCVCLLGVATHDAGRWYNSVVVVDPAGTRQLTHKVELSELDRRHFAPGPRATVLEVAGVRVGIQICREVLFPTTWSRLAREGAEILFHVNNAIKPYDDVWEHVLIARAVENRIPVCSVNNAAPPQELRSYLIAPSGRLLVRSDRQAEQVLAHDLDLEDDRFHPY